MSCVCYAIASIHCCLVVTWRERAALLVLDCDFIVILLLSHLVNWDWCGTWLYRFLILPVFLIFITLITNCLLKERNKCTPTTNPGQPIYFNLLYWRFVMFQAICTMSKVQLNWAIHFWYGGWSVKMWKPKVRYIDQCMNESSLLYIAKVLQLSSSERWL